MGIPSFFSYIVRNHIEIIQKLNRNKNVDNLYLDCNSIIYDVYGKLITSSELNETIALSIIKSVCAKIEYYIKLIQPSTRVIIAFDGVAPVAKLDQQRSRRYKTSYQNQLTKQIYKKVGEDPWNTSAITPGTTFMKELSQHVKLHFGCPHTFNLKSIIVSTSDDCGEGEHKIFEYIRDNVEEHSNGSTVIYGLDADLIVLSMNHLPICNQIYLFRETPHFIQSINADLEPNANYVLDIPLLSNKVLQYMNNNNISTIQEKHSKTYDYIFLSFLLGNDFLPHFPAINIRTGGIDKLLNVYRETLGKTSEVLTDGKIVYWNNLRTFIKTLSIQEESYLKTEYKLRDKKAKIYYPTDSPEQMLKKLEAIPTYDRDLEKYINPFKDYWQSRYYRSLFNISGNDTEEQIKQVCINYLEGLEWTLKYYTTNCPDWRWRYKYQYPPLLTDLIKYIPVLETEFIQNKPRHPVSPIVQLCYVLPYSSLQLLPKQLYSKLLTDHKNWYRTDCEFKWAFCKYFWESHVEMDEINIEELEKFIEKNSYLLL
uniref:Xrn1 N-terminal domain-containing protein n=1 Tax=viral metagenome TaxID=1070528 RepID=A0A6C0E227_9ZZZZ